MAEFPLRENEILGLAQRIIDGLRDNPEVFPAPMVDADRLEEVREEFNQARARARRVHTEAKKATKDKCEALDQLKSDMKTALRYVEYMSRSDDRKLRLVGWGKRRPGKKLDAPGQVQDLRIFKEGRDWIALEWDPPHKETGTGRATAYRVERARGAADEWANARMAFETSIMLKDQERGVEWHYRVIAVNRKGEGLESNVVTAVM